MSGLKINFSKSSLCGVNVPADNVVSLARIMGCKVERLPMKYLGLPLGTNPGRIITWDPVCQSMERRLSKWKVGFLSSGGRLTLINSNTANLPIYYMSIFKMPSAVAKKLEKMQRNFFWGDSVNRKKIHMVRWDVIARSKKDGGLGVKRLLQQNSALLAKWWWRFGSNKESLWVKVIKGKYGMQANSWLPYHCGVGATSRIWKDICSIDSSTSHLGFSIREGFKIEVNSGEATTFWEHVWLGDRPLKEEYPRLFSLSTQRKTSVYRMKGKNNVWLLQFRRPLREWERQVLEELNQRLQGFMLNPLEPDALVWRWSPDSQFSVKSAYGRWQSIAHQNNALLEKIWKNLGPFKVKIFVWMAIQGKVATRGALLTKNVISQYHLALCPLCQLQMESNNHLFLHCHFVWKVWASIIEWWKVEWVCPPTVESAAAGWFDNSYRNLEKHSWEAYFFATVWSIWLVRNDYIFNSALTQAQEVGELIKSRVAMWMKAV